MGRGSQAGRGRQPKPWRAIREARREQGDRVVRWIGAAARRERKRPDEDAEGVSLPPNVIRLTWPEKDARAPVSSTIEGAGVGAIVSMLGRTKGIGRNGRWPAYAARLI